MRKKLTANSSKGYIIRFTCIKLTQIFNDHLALFNTNFPAIQDNFRSLFASWEIVNVHRCLSVDYQDESKDILNSILKEEVLPESDSEGSIEESRTNEVLK